MESPVQIGQLIDLDIHGLASNAEGIGRYNGFTIFVPQALPGDKIRVEVISIKKNYGRALIKSIINPSPDRVDPVCPYYEKCGGCQLMHAKYDAQLSYKQKQVESTLKHIGNLVNVNVKSIIGMAGPFHYRNKAHFPTGKENHKLIAGCYTARSHDIIDIESCAIQHGQINHLLRVAKKAADKYGISTYDEKKHSGLLRNILVRHSYKTGQSMIVFVINGRELPREKEIAAYLLANTDNLVSIQLNINRSKGNKLLGSKTRLISGQDHIIDEINGLLFKISASSFYQVNPEQTSLLYKIASEYASLSGREVVFDIYCGVGTIALLLSEKAKKVIGIDILPEATKDACFNASLNNIKNCDFITGAAEVIMPKLINEGHIPGICVIDPPRTGCREELLHMLLIAAPEKIIYISCNPATLARDIKLLCEKVYTVEEVQPLDMFPFTRHVEAVVLMSRIEK